MIESDMAGTDRIGTRWIDDRRAPFHAALRLRPFPTPVLNVRVLLFSVLRDGVGAGELSTAVEPGATGADLLDRLAAAYPAVALHRSVVRLAINRRYAPSDTPLADGDEVALITPVSGG